VGNLPWLSADQMRAVDRLMSDEPHDPQDPWPAPGPGRPGALSWLSRRRHDARDDAPGARPL